MARMRNEMGGKELIGRFPRAAGQAVGMIVGAVAAGHREAPVSVPLDAAERLPAPDLPSAARLL